nr:hypothetical protein [Tanacetum cinerariifolium]
MLRKIAPLAYRGRGGLAIKLVCESCGAHALCRYARIMILVGLRGSCSLRPCASYTSRGATISLVDHTIQDELNVNSGKRKKRVAFVSGSSLVKKARTKGIVSSDSRPSKVGKSPTALRRLTRQGEQAAAGSGSAAPAMEDVTSSSITPTPERALEDALHDNVRTRPPSGRFVVLSSGSVDTDIHATPQVVPLVSSSQAGVSVHVTESTGDGLPLSALELGTGTLSATSSQGSSADDFCESHTIDSATAMNVYIPN